MNLENEIKGIIEQKLSEGLIEKLVAENIEKSINKALESLTGHYGDITKVIEKNLKEVMVKQIEGYDFTQYVVKLDDVLTNILKNTALDNKKVLENFKSFMVDEEIPKKVQISKIFEKYCDYASKEVNTSDLEVCTDDEPSYQNIECSFEVQEHEKRRYISYQTASAFFECNEDEDLNIEVKFNQWTDSCIKGWRLDLNRDINMVSLRHTSEFIIYLLKLSQNCVEIEFDKHGDSCEVEVEAEPEASFC